MNIRVVYGPPMGGKTTYVLNHCNAGDLILDIDRIYEAISGLSPREKRKDLLPYAIFVFDALVEKIRQLPHDAWIITTIKEKADRIEKVFKAQRIDLIPLMDECLKRIKGDSGRDTDYYREIIKNWYSQYKEIL